MVKIAVKINTQTTQKSGLERERILFGTGYLHHSKMTLAKFRLNYQRMVVFVKTVRCHRRDILLYFPFRVIMTEMQKK